MTNFSKVVASLIVVATVTMPAFAAEPVSPLSSAAAIDSERIALARQFVAISYSEDSFVELIRESSLSAAEAFTDAAGGVDTAKVSERVEKYVEIAEPVIRKHAPLILEANAQAVARAYSTSELRDLLAFASTATGKKYLTTVDGTESDPAVIAAYMTMHVEMQPLIHEIDKAECAAAAKQRLAMGDTKARCPLAGEALEAAGQD